MTPTNTQGSEQAAPNPNEVMDVDRIHKLVKHQLREARSTTKTVTNLAKPIKTEIERYVAQQNAALLREALSHKKYVENTQPPRYTVDASILEAKLKELDTTEEVKI